MIEHKTVDGRQATVCYLTRAFEPAERDDAYMAKVIYEDGDVAFINLREEDDRTLKT